VNVRREFHSLLTGLVLVTAVAGSVGAEELEEVVREGKALREHVSVQSVEAVEGEEITKDRLEAMIRKLNAIRVPPPARKAVAAKPVETATATPQAASRPVATEAAAGPELSPESVADPAQALQVADCLYRAGRRENALPFYERVATEAAGSPPGEWALLQKGVCTEATDLREAAETYRTLAASGSESVWAQMAAVREQLCRWRARESIEELFEDPTP